MELLNQYLESILDLIYPPNISCIVCNHQLLDEDKYGICQHCLRNISFIGDNSCIKCAKPFIIEKNSTNEGCSECHELEYNFNRALAVVAYTDAVQNLVYKFKYKDATYLSKNMAMMMEDRFRDSGLSIDMIMAVPLHTNKKKKRGYNQSHLLAKYISKNLSIYYNKKDLVRIKDTKAMYNLTKLQRKENVKGGFQVIDGKEIEGKSILLVDDIFTTGATVNACSEAIIKSGAKSIVILTFARGV